MVPIRHSAVLLLVLAACATDPCKEATPSFQLDIRAPADIGARSLEVTLTIGAEQRFRTFNLADELADGETSLAVVVDPSPVDSFQLDVAVSAYAGADASGVILAMAARTFVGTPDGCNRFSVDLAGAGPDAGIFTFTCGGSETCSETCGAGACSGQCGGNSICTLSCGTSTDCRLRCNGNAVCLLRCESAGACAIQDCNATTCADGSLACNRACP